MIITCSKCGEKFESLIIDREIAYTEIFNASCKHVKNKHNAMFLEMARAVAVSLGALTTFLHFNEFILVREEETFVVDKVEQAQEVVLAAMGFDPEEEEDEEDEGEEEPDEPDTGVIDLPEIETVKS